MTSQPPSARPRRSAVRSACSQALGALVASAVLSTAVLTPLASRAAAADPAPAVVPAERAFDITG